MATSDPMLGDIRLWPGNRAPLGWLFCDGRLLSISTYDTLYLLLGTTYGGDGTSTFALPDLRGRVPMGVGSGIGLSSYSQAETGGAEQVTLTANQLPAHSHKLQGQNGSGNSADPAGRALARPAPSGGLYKPGGTDAAMAGTTSGTGSGGNQSHNNRQPFLALNFIICVEGIFPSQP